jgi:uncharacterized protein
MCLGAGVVCAAQSDPIPEPSSLVVDQAGVLSPADQQALVDRLQMIQASGRAQIAILISTGVHGEALSEYSLRVADAWQIGRGKADDGLVILVVPSMTAARLEVGYGLEGVITDALASRWLDEFLPSVKNKEVADGLNHLLDQIDSEIPAVEANVSSSTGINFLDLHPELKLPFVLAIFSPLALFPMFLSRWGSLASAPIFAAFMSGASWTLWHSQTRTVEAGTVAFVLPLLWGLNRRDGYSMSAWLRYARGFANLIAVVIFFSVITLFVGMGLSGNVEEVWAAPIFAGMLALALAVFLFPGKPAEYLMILLRSCGHFVIVLMISYFGLQSFIPHPTTIAFSTAGAFTACVALALYLDSRGTTRWSLVLMGLALLIALPFGLVLLVQSVLGEDFHLRLAQAATGGGSLAGILWWVASRGFFASVKIGLGGRFGGGGAERVD